MRNLTKNSFWEYRISYSSGAKTPWTKTIPENLTPDFLWENYPPIQNWRIYTLKNGLITLENADPKKFCLYSSNTLSKIPANLRLYEDGGLELISEDIKSNSEFIELSRYFGNIIEGKTAIAFSEFSLNEDSEIHFFVGADWWFQLYIDGKEILNTINNGNKYAPIQEYAHTCSVTLPKGRHTIAMRVISGNGGWSFAIEIFKKIKVNKNVKYSPHINNYTNAVFETRNVFVYNHDPKLSYLSYTCSEDIMPYLNGKKISPPLKNMSFRTIYGISTKLLKDGQNYLKFSFKLEEAKERLQIPPLKFFKGVMGLKPIPFSLEIKALSKKDAKIITGPVITRLSKKSYTIYCRTNLPCPLKIKSKEKEIITSEKLFHIIKIPKIHDGERVTIYTEKEKAELSAKKSFTGKNITFALFGDPSPQIEIFRTLLYKIMLHNPEFALLLGDLTSNGCKDWLWDEHFFSLCPKFFRTIPVLAIPGNHENNSPLFNTIFLENKTKKNWTLKVKDMIIVGIDGALDWSKKENLLWLEKTFLNEKYSLKILLNHYPPFTASAHGEKDSNGNPKEKEMSYAKNFILPTALRCGVNFIFSGHSHCYEKYLYNGIYCINSGGAGGYLYKKKINISPEPLIYTAEHHYCIAQVNPLNSDFSFTVFNLSGKILDQFKINYKTKGVSYESKTA